MKKNLLRIFVVLFSLNLYGCNFGVCVGTSAVCDTDTSGSPSPKPSPDLNSDDPDKDGICTGEKTDSCTSGKDNCPNNANPDQADSNNNGKGDVCEDSNLTPSS